MGEFEGQKLRFLIPVTIGPCPLLSSLEDFHTIDVGESDGVSLARSIDSGGLGEAAETQGPPGESGVNQISPISASQASTRSRYPGTRPFTEFPEDQARFFGRDREGEQLYLRVLSVSLLLQFAKSGLGKTSLLQASLFPRLRQKPFLPVMVRLNVKEESLVDAVARSFEQACKAEGLEFPELRKDGLWELLSTALVWRDDLLLTPVLVFDQFEEVFTLRDRVFRDELAEELGALATGVPPERLRPKQGGRARAARGAAGRQDRDQPARGLPRGAGGIQPRYSEPLP